ncbi:helix-turn-helix domain-containing protein [Neolewinella aurantiaca]|uniref:Helix-turn-helix domain-containing protein n=1 Tax=Neolewinella aurantiaca TaxID=2602767 RepID=A0A5C7FCX6_9BACT|nr:helix-turn-helix domain-containing protein [Neolewinella aurantiaca]TXF88816.1 helix-turn-helix domain-containing protein [Neolewinella aurantiaca]
MSLSLSDFFVLASILQGFFLGIAILIAPFFRSETNVYLGWSVIMMSLITFLGWQDFGNFWIDYAWSLMLEFLFPALLFQYFLKVLDHPYLRAWWLPLVYAPFFVFLLVDLVIDLDFVFDVYELPFSPESPGFDFFDSLEDSLALWYNIFMISWMFRLARADTRLAPLKRQWLVRFSIAMVGILAIWFLSDLVRVETSIDNPYAAIWIAISVLFWWIAYVGVYQLRILDEQTEIHHLLHRNRSVVREEPVLVAATATANNSYAPALESLMQEEELFRNPDLGRQLVAERLGISEGYVSEIMQDSVGKSFVEYVNSYRVDAAKLMLKDQSFAPYSLEAIGREAGFRSRSTFYEAFKKATGLTPGLYRKQQKPS